jgi:hypothetical protein
MITKAEIEKAKKLCKEYGKVLEGSVFFMDESSIGFDPSEVNEFAEQVLSHVVALNGTVPKLIEAVEKMTAALERISFAHRYPVERPMGAQYGHIAHTVLEEVWREENEVSL